MKKTSRIGIKLSLLEKVRIENKAKQLGFTSVSRYMRLSALGVKTVPKVDTMTLMQIRRIGVNINQMVALCNRYRTIEMILNVEESLMMELNELNELLAALKQKIEEA